MEPTRWKVDPENCPLPNNKSDDGGKESHRMQYPYEEPYLSQQQSEIDEIPFPIPNINNALSVMNPGTKQPEKKSAEHTILK